jgi:biotin operon repressor
MPSADQKSESPVTAFIPSWLDDSDLTPNEFRVLCAIFRRGNCFESVPKLARRIRMHRDTVWTVLKSLEARGAIVRTDRAGRTTLFSAMPVSFWAQPSGNGGPAENSGYPSKQGDTQPLNSASTKPEIRGSHPAEYEGYKGNPVEVSPVKSIPAKGAQAEVLKFSEVYDEASRIGLPLWRAAEWLNEIGDKPIEAWRERLQLVFLKWELDGRREKPTVKPKG